MGILIYINTKTETDRAELGPNLNAVIRGNLKDDIGDELARKVRIVYRRIPKDAQELGRESLKREQKDPESTEIKAHQRFIKVFGRQLLRWVDLSIID